MEMGELRRMMVCWSPGPAEGRAEAEEVQQAVVKGLPELLASPTTTFSLRDHTKTFTNIPPQAQITQVEIAQAWSNLKLLQDQENNFYMGC